MTTTRGSLPTECAEVPRRSLDSFGPEWAPAKFPDAVDVCGDWAVMLVDGGYFAWMPIPPGEANG